MASDIGKLGTIVAVITFIVLVVRYLIKIALENQFSESIWSYETL